MKKPTENPSKVVIVPKPPKETSNPSTTQSEQEATQESAPDEEKPEKAVENPEA